MSAYSSVLGVVVLLLHLWMTHSLPVFQACPVPCLCQQGPLLNCSSLGLTKTSEHIPPTAVSLNISHNALHSLAPLSDGHVKLKGLLHLWVGSNFLESIDLVLGKKISGTRTLSSEEQECMTFTWAPDLQLLSADRNRLKHLPGGLHCLKSLQILQLSYNQISEIGPTDLTNSTSLKELHLQQNHITNIHSHAFIYLKQLQVLDLSYNHLATVPVPAYQSLQNLNALVNISFNKWKCDCNLQTLRRWISFDAELGDASWQVVCDSPSHHAGKDLLHLKDSDLTCPTREHSTSGHYRNIMVDEGTQISLSCNNDGQDFMQVHWWTPHGQVTENQPELLMKDITEQHEGLYICAYGLQLEHISVFDVQVYTKASDPRPRREAPIIPDERVEQEKTNAHMNSLLQATKTQSEFVLAVCLSVFITFIVAFILGVLLRPLLDKLWRRIRSKRHSSPSPTTSRVSSTGPQPYVNEGFSDAGDHEQVVRVGSRVTFGEITEVGDQGRNVPYYVTVEDAHSDGSSESNTEVEIVYENTQKRMTVEKDDHRGRANSISSSSTTQEGEVNVLGMKDKALAPSSTTELQPIPDAHDITQPKRKSSTSSSSSSSSSSSHSRKTLDRNISSEVRESTEQSVDPPAVTIPVHKTTTNDEIPGFTKEPFTGWPTGLTEQNVDFDSEFWNDSGESFSFNEESEKSSVRDLSSSALRHPVSDNDTWRQGNIESPTNKLNFTSHVLIGKEVSVDDVNQLKRSDTLSSSSSSESSDFEGPNSYTVNPELGDKSEIFKESYRKIDSDKLWTPDSDKLWTPEDDNFNKSQPAAGIRIRQETITLDPSDIHLGFTHEESVDEDMLMDESQRISEGIFGIWTDVSLDTVPKVKRYVQFTQSKPSISPSSKKKNVTPEIEKSEAEVDTSPGDSHLTQTKVSFEGISKVKRYIHFKPSDTHSPTLPSSPYSPNKDLRVEARRHSTSSEDEAELTSDEEKVFRKTGVSPACVPKVKRYIQFNQIPPASPTLSVFRPSTKIESTTKKYRSPPTDQRKQLSSSNFSPEGLLLYHVHPSYKTNQSRLNKESDRSSSESSSEDEDQHTAYPRKLEIKTEPEINKGSMTQDKNTENVLNIDFDNSSSSTDVFEKKPIKGLARLKMLSTLLFNRHNNETEVQTGTTTPDQSYKMHLTEDMVQTTTNEDTFLGHIQSPDQSLPLVMRENTHEEKAEFNSKRSSLSSSSDEGSISPKHEEDVTLEKRLSLDQLPKVKRCIQFSYSDPHSQAWLPSPPPTTRVVTPDLTATNESRRSSSEDDVKQSTEDQNFYGLSKIKRYIKFTHTEPYSPTQQTNKQSISLSIVAPPDSRRSSSSSEDDIKAVVETISSTPIMLNVRSDPNEIEVKSEAKVNTSPREPKEQGKLFIERIPKVKRYIHFKQSEPYSPILPILSTSPNKDVRVEAKRYSTSSEDEAELTTVATTGAVMKSLQSSSSSEDEFSPTTEENEFFEETGVSFDRIPQVKKYLQFKQPLPHRPVAPPTTTLNMLHVTPESKTKQESQRLSSSSEDDDTPTAQLFVQTRTESFDRIPKVKRYIHFTQSENQSSVPSTTSQMISKSVVVHEIRKSSSSSEEDVKLSSNDEEQVTGESFVKIQKVKRYIQFTQSEDFMGLSPFPLKSTKVDETEVRGANTLDKDDVQPAKRKNKTESRRMSTSSSEDDYTITTKEDHFRGQIGTSLDRIPKVKRYIHFTHPERHSPPLPSTAQKVKISSVIQETRRLSTSSEEDVKPSTKNYNSVYRQMDASFSQLPKVQKYIEFKQHETSLPVNSSAMEDIKLNKLSVTSIKTYSTYKTKAGIETESSSSSSDESPPSSIVVKTESELVKSELFQIGLKPELQKSNYLSRDHRDLVGHVVKDVSSPQNDPPAVPQTPPPLLEQDDAREYLRDNSQVRQRQERRRILQQRRKGMDDYSFTSLSSISQEGNKQDSGSLMDYREATLMHSEHAQGSAFTANNVTSRRTEVAEGQTLQGLKTKKTSALRSKSPTDSANTKYKEFLI